MRNRLVSSIVLLAALALAAPVLADPPDHAPAHGYRGKHKHHKHHKHRDDHHHHHGDRDHGDRARDPFPGPGGFQVVFDPERGVAIAVGFPGVVFHEDHYYRRHDGFWQRSLRADSGWERVSMDATPATIRHAFPPPPVPAKLDPRPVERMKPMHKKWMR